MAEISYPFAAESEGGGSPMVSQIQWQNMSRMFGCDRIDFQLTETSYTGSGLPFYASLDGSGDIVVQPGKAWVGGFYYQLTSPLVLPAPFNASSNPRIDSLVLRVDFTNGSVNLAIKTGQPASNPVEPTLDRTPGGVWEMVLWAIHMHPNGGIDFLSDRRRFDEPARVTTHVNESLIAERLPVGSWTVDMDTNNSWFQYEGFKGRDGHMITRTLGKRLKYTPDLFTVSGKPAAGYREGWWRYTAPGTVQFSVRIRTPTTTAVTASGGTSIIAFTLPVNTTRASQQVFHGFLDNPEERNNMPNFMAITAKTGNGGNPNCYLYVPNWQTLAQGLDALRTIPGKSILYVNGVYETDLFD